MRLTNVKLTQPGLFMNGICSKVREADNVREKSANGYRTASGSDRMLPLNLRVCFFRPAKVERRDPVATARGSVSEFCRRPALTIDDHSFSGLETTPRRA